MGRATAHFKLHNTFQGFYFCKMAQPFSFGFSGDDIEEDPNDAPNQNDDSAMEGVESGPSPIPAQTHSLDELVGKMFLLCLQFYTLIFVFSSRISIFPIS